MQACVDFPSKDKLYYVLGEVARLKTLYQYPKLLTILHCTRNNLYPVGKK